MEDFKVVLHIIGGNSKTYLIEPDEAGVLVDNWVCGHAECETQNDQLIDFDNVCAITFNVD